MKRKLIFILVASLVQWSASAQKGNIGFVYPPGAQKGTTIELTVGGQGLGSAQGIIVSGDGVSGELIAAPAGANKKKRKNKNIGEEDNLQLSDLVKFRLTVDKTASSGIRDVRLVLKNGLSNRLYFEVGELPDVSEKPKEALSAKSSTLPVTFNGQIMNRDVDRFRFTAKAGQQLVLRVKARVFVPYMADAVPGWFQPIIRLYGPDGKEVAYNDDYNFHVDPVLFYKVPVGGEYEVEINDALYRGREDFVYRIDVGELPFITSISPLGGECGRKVKLTLEGYNLETKTMKLKPRQPGLLPVRVTGRNGTVSNSLVFDASDLTPLNVEKAGPNDSRSAALPISLGQVCEQTFGAHMQAKWYVLDIQKRTAVHMMVKSRRLGTNADVRMTVFNSDGTLLKDVDDFENPDDCMTTHFADPELAIVMKPGVYYIRLTEAQGHWGSEYAYRFSVEEASADFSLNIEPSTFTVPVGGTGIFTVMLNRKQNFRGEVSLDVTGLPAGFKYTALPLLSGQKKTYVSVTAPSDAAQGTVFPKVSGEAKGKDGAIIREARPVETMMQAFYYTHYMPVDEFRMELSPRQPFRIEVDRNPKKSLCMTPGTGFDLKVKLVRDPGYASAVTVMLRTTLSGVKAEAVVIPGDSSEGILHVNVKGNRKNKKDIFGAFYVYGVVKASSNKLKGKSRNAYVASVTANTPVFEAYIPGTGVPR